MVVLTAGLGCSSHHFDSVCRLYQGMGNFWDGTFFFQWFWVGGGWVSWVESGQIYWHKIRFIKGYRGFPIDAPILTAGKWLPLLMTEAFNEIKTQEQELEEAREEVESWKEPNPVTFFWWWSQVSFWSFCRFCKSWGSRLYRDKVHHQP